MIPSPPFGPTPSPVFGPKGQSALGGYTGDGAKGQKKLRPMIFSSQPLAGREVMG